MKPSFSYSIFSLFVLCFSVATHSYGDDRLRHYRQLILTEAAGPESIAFDCNREGPYTGVSDGRILKWNAATGGWTEFAVTSKARKRVICDGLNDPKLEQICGRPLGLKFDKRTCDLYIADAYFGLLRVGPNGGVAQQLATSANGVPFRLTNSVDIDEETGVVYFTDSTIFFQRWQYVLSIISSDKTGRLMKYDPRSKKVTVLLNGIAFANGVALSKDKSFVIVAETGKSRILRYWLQGQKSQTTEGFAQLGRFPDNIKRKDNGEFWVGLNSGRGILPKFVASKLQYEGVSPWLTQDVVAVRLDEKGKVMEMLDGKGEKTFGSVSEVEENEGTLWVGSVVTPYVGILKP